jgi:hypothetical protein
MKRIALLAFLLVALSTSAVSLNAQTAKPELPPTRGDVETQISIDKLGTVSLKGARIVQIAGSNMFVTTSWGSAKIRWVIVASKDTTLTRRFGGATSINEFDIDEYINVTGTMYGSGGDSLVIKATSIKNWSKENEPGEFSGTIANIDFGKKTFTLIVPDAPNVLVTAPPSLSVKKGARSISFGDLANGDRVLSTGGTFNVIDRSLAIDRIEIFQEQSIFVPRNFQGTLKNISATTLPTTATIRAEGKDYTVYLSEKTIISNKLKEKASLQRFLVGDTVRLYGAIRKTNLTEIDNVEVFRNIDL